ncbi:MAG TPA: hypothetical protein VMV29_04865 [Ktedonobacterales bacterium]|nr:hypothetical protein [Ktedonobacterales bacterium]
MAVRVGELEPRQVERMRTELGEIMIASFAYPPFFDFRANRLSRRPVDQAKRDEIALFLNSVNLAPLNTTDVASPELRRFVERLFLRYLEVNPALTHPRQARRAPELHSQTPRLAADFQRSLQAFLNGAAPAFGARRPPTVWATPVPRDSRLPPEERIHNTRVLEAILLRNGPPSGALAGMSGDLTTPVPAQAYAQPVARPSADNAANGAPSGERRNGTARNTHSPFAGLDTGAQSAILHVSEPGMSFGPGQGVVIPSGPSGPVVSSMPPSQPAPAYARSITEQPTGPLRVVRPPAARRPNSDGLGANPRTNGAGANGAGANGAGAATRDGLPSDLYQLYGDFLQDMQPEAPLAAPGPPSSAPLLPHYPAHPYDAGAPARQIANGAANGPLNIAANAVETATPPPYWLTGSAPSASPAPARGIGHPAENRVVAPAPTSAPRPSAPSPAAPAQPVDPEAGRNDLLIFWQLRYQLEAYVRRGAYSYGVANRGGDPASVLDALRTSGFVDEADLRIAEGIFALTDRVTARGQASIDDYQEALMLYLLYHRSHLRN